MTINRLFFLLIVFTIACGDRHEFNQEGWRRRSDIGLFPERDAMVNDLISNHKLIGLKYKDLILKLGPPDFWETTDRKVYYGLEVNYGADIDPTGLKSLEFELNQDSVITNVKLSGNGH